MQKTAYELRISDWSSDVCSSDLLEQEPGNGQALPFATRESVAPVPHDRVEAVRQQPDQVGDAGLLENRPDLVVGGVPLGIAEVGTDGVVEHRSEEHTSELQSLMRNSYAVFCLKKKKQQNNTTNND